MVRFLVAVVAAAVLSAPAAACDTLRAMVGGYCAPQAVTIRRAVTYVPPAIVQQQIVEEEPVYTPPSVQILRQVAPVYYPPVQQFLAVPQKVYYPPVQQFLAVPQKVYYPPARQVLLPQEGLSLRQQSYGTPSFQQNLNVQRGVRGGPALQQNININQTRGGFLSRLLPRNRGAGRAPAVQQTFR
jgi:hypothetical protein